MASVASSVARYSPFFKKQNIRTVLDFGAGTLRNSCFLAEIGFCVYAVDVPEQVERIRAIPCNRCLAGVLSTSDLERKPLAVDPRGFGKVLEEFTNIPPQPEKISPVRGESFYNNRLAIGD